jgi:hypothetical protein
MRPAWQPTDLPAGSWKMALPHAFGELPSIASIRWAKRRYPANEYFSGTMPSSSKALLSTSNGKSVQGAWEHSSAKAAWDQGRFAKDGVVLPLPKARLHNVPRAWASAWAVAAGIFSARVSASFSPRIISTLPEFA